MTTRTTTTRAALAGAPFTPCQLTERMAAVAHGALGGPVTIKRGAK